MTDLEFLSLQKSTIVRSRSMPAAALLRPVAAALAATAPGLAARLAERLFITPIRHRRPAHEAAALAGARRETVRVDGRAVATWTWGQGPTVLLVHGWSGRGSQLASFVPPLVARGFAVTAWDAPGHGDSEGRTCTAADVAAALRAVAATRPDVRAVIAHSLGAMATARAMADGLQLDAAVFVTPPADATSFAAIFAESLGFSRRVRALMEARIVRRVGAPWSAFDVARLAESQRAPLLVVHDREDGDVPWQHGRAVAAAWPGARLTTTDGLGHRRILRDSRVIAEATAFVTTHAYPWRWPGPAVTGSVPAAEVALAPAAS